MADSTDTLLAHLAESIGGRTKTLTAGAGISLDESGSTITINSSASAVAVQMLPLLTALDAGRSVGIYATGDSTGAGDQPGTEGTDATQDRTHLAFVRRLAAAHPGHCALVRSWQPEDEKLGPWVTLQAGSAGREGFRFTGYRSMWFKPAATDVDPTITSNVLDIQVLVGPDAITSTNPQCLAARVGAWNENGSDDTTVTWGAGHQFRFELTGDSHLKLVWTAEDGAAWGEQWQSTAPLTAVATQWLRVVQTIVPGASLTVQFYTSPDGGTWTELGTTQSWSGAVAKMMTPPRQTWFEVGAFAKSDYALTGEIYEVRILDGRDGRPVVPAALHAWRRYGDNAVQQVGSPTIYFVNGSRSGSDMTYHTDPTRGPKETVDYGTVLAMFNNSHNEAWKTGRVEWQAPYKAWVEGVLNRLPAAAALVIIQNPHTSAWPHEAAYGREHVTRLMELAALATREGWAIADVYNAFMSDSRGLDALILPDGLHLASAGYALAGATIGKLAGV